MRIEFINKSTNLDLFINKIICWNALGDYEKAIFEYDNKCPENLKLNDEILYQIMIVQMNLHNYDLAINMGNLAEQKCINEIMKEKFTLLNGLLYAKKFDWNNAIEKYKNLSTSAKYNKVSEINLSLVDKLKFAKQKKPAIAGILSIIPGGGYAYAGHKQTAISALLVNGLLGYAAYNSFKIKNYGMGILTGVFGLSFYVGNIIGGNKSAKRYNENKKKSIINKLISNSNL
jgi:hypothetical protein